MGQSPELAGGAGFTFEDQVAACYLVALLGEAHATGTSDRIVTRVALQQRDFGEPLDDLIVDATAADGSSMRLSLQCKRTIRITGAATNDDFRNVMNDAWDTRRKQEFRTGVDRYGAAVGNVALGPSRSLKTLCELARNSGSANYFEARFGPKGNASRAVAQVKGQVVAILAEKLGRVCSAEELQDFLAHFLLLEFDLGTEVSEVRSNAVNQLASYVTSGPDGHDDTGTLVWAWLCQRAAETKKWAPQISRERVLRDLPTTIKLKPGRLSENDLRRLHALAVAWLADIGREVGGVHLERPELRTRVDEALRTTRVVQIRGLAGCGKSALLRDVAEAALEHGPAIVLKHDRLDGRSWQGFAAAHRLSGLPVKKVLTEVGATGTPIIFIDGLDRVAREHRGVVLDVIRPILTDPDLENWRVIASLRSNSIEAVRSWMGDLLDQIAIGTVEVDTLSEDEAWTLARASPALRDLLSRSGSVSEIVRRPFFAKVLSRRGPAAVNAPASEADLVGEWWARAGSSDVLDADVTPRQRALLELAGHAMRSLGRPVPISRLSETASRWIEPLIGDGVIQRIAGRPGLVFSHDIFLEWSAYQLLEDNQDAWSEELRLWGEPPAAARPVELRSQREFLEGEGWYRSLRDLQGSGMRSQWTRVWLLAPLSLPNFEEHGAFFASLVLADDMRLLRSSLVWFQAERTTPNPNILIRNELADERIRIADALGWPADVPTWTRFIRFLLGLAPRLPHDVLPAVATIFEVWQNAFAPVRNPLTAALLGQVEAWFRDGDRPRRPEHTPLGWWPRDERPGSLPCQLASLILRSAAAEPAFAERHLRSLLDREKVGEHAFDLVVTFALTLSQSHPALLVDVVLAHLRDELPQARIESEQRSRQQHAAYRRRLASKDPTELTETDRRYLQLGGPSLLSLSAGFSQHDWNRLALRHVHKWFPPSPLREPFLSLFTNTPGEALRLVAELANHAVTAWRQLHELDPNSRGTPLPVRLSFPWGDQEFWGNSREHLWGRGVWAPEAVACAFMALSRWAMEELRGGRDADELIRVIVSNHQSVGALTVAVDVALQADLASEAAFPLVTSLRLLGADKGRYHHDLTAGMTELIGFEAHHDVAHVQSLKAALSLEVRRRELSDLFIHYLLRGGPMTERFKAAVAAFPDALPFLYAEDQDSPEWRDELTLQAARFAELADPGTYRFYRSDTPGQVIAVHESPTASTSEAEQARQEAGRNLDVTGLWMWAEKCFETGQPSPEFTLDRALEIARGVDGPSLFDEMSAEDDLGQRLSAVAAVAAVCLNYPTGIDAGALGWARRVVNRAAASVDLFGPGRLPRWNHAVFAARGLSALFAAGIDPGNAASALLGLATNSSDVVALAGLEQSLKVHQQDPRLGWCALLATLSMCEMRTGRQDEPDWRARQRHRASDLALAAQAAYRGAEPWPALPAPPLPWIPNDQESGGVDAGARGRFRSRGTPGWMANPNQWDWHHAAEILPLVPVRPFLDGPRRRFLDFLRDLMTWHSQTCVPPWASRDGKPEVENRPFEFTLVFGRLLGRAAGLMEISEVQDVILGPTFALPGDACWDLLDPFVDAYVGSHVIHGSRVPAEASTILDACVSRLLAAPALRPGSWNDGVLTGMHLPKLVRALFLVNVTDDPRASRFANGDWTALPTFLPLLDRLLRAAGWSATVMASFLLLCERSRAEYPAMAFADQMLHVLDSMAATSLAEWRHTTLPARIAGLVQHFSEQEMAVELARKLLRILDHLVDMGDRRAGALQAADVFRRVPAGDPRPVGSPV